MRANQFDASESVVATNNACATKEDCAHGTWMSAAHTPDMAEVFVGPNELVSLNALICHAASLTHQPAFRLERDVADHFNLPNMRLLPVSQYDEAVGYIVAHIPPATNGAKQAA